MRILLVLALAALPFLQGPRSTPQAATVVLLDFEQQAKMADLAFEGTVVHARPEAHPDGSIWTEYTLSVAETWCGANQSERTIRLPGGVLPNGFGMMTPGVPQLALGERAVLLLAEEGGRHMPVGLAQGKLRIVPGAAGRSLAVRNLEEISFSGAAHLEHASADVFDYADLKARLTAAFATRGEGRGR